MYIRIPSRPLYPHQFRCMQAISQGKNCLAVVHRRAGKDIFCMEAWVYRGLRRVGTHVYLFPMYSQARSVIWEGIDGDGKPFLSALPRQLIASKNEQRMEIKLINGSRLVLAGSNNIDSLMGTNPVTIIYSEFSLHNPLARQYLNPILIQNQGMEILNYTPRGMNHGYEVYEQVKDNPNYHIEHLGVDQTFKHDGVTPIITEEDIKEAAARGMSEEMIRQEFYVDFEVGNVGSYFTREYGILTREKRVFNFYPDTSLPLHSIWDLGGTDSTAGILFQVDGTTVRILALIHKNNEGLEYYLKEANRMRESWGLNWGQHWMPHDVKQGHQGWQHTESRLVQARRSGWHFQVIPHVNFNDGIESIRYLLTKVFIHQSNCQLLLAAIREYQRKYDEVKKRYSDTPLDNWTVHIVDALRYLAVIYKRLFQVPVGVGTYGLGN